jgi:hypothetical protein
MLRACDKQPNIPRHHVQEPCRLRPFLSPLPVTPATPTAYSPTQTLAALLVWEQRANAVNHFQGVNITDATGMHLICEVGLPCTEPGTPTYPKSRAVLASILVLLPFFSLAGTVRPYTIRLLVEDDGGEEAAHANLTTKLLFQDSVHFLFGGHARTSGSD